MLECEMFYPSRVMAPATPQHTEVLAGRAPRAWTRVVVLGALLASLGCGGDPPGVPDAAILDAPEASTDASPDGNALEDASRDAGVDAEAPCACPPFERCGAAGCECAPGEALCGTRGRAGFPLVAPDARSLVVDGDVVVRDEVTGLVWQRETDGVARTFDDAATYCAALTLAGRADWRLPARVELASILDAERTPSLDTDAFPDPIADYHWTASRPRAAPGAAYAIYFGQGETVIAGADVAGAHVRCVAGSRAEVPPSRAEGDLVHDDATGLSWDRDHRDALTYAEAEAHCVARGGRLPTLYELHDLVDESRGAPSADVTLFPATPAAPFWTSTPRDFGEILAWVVDFELGESALLEHYQAAAARCVRSGS